MNNTKNQNTKREGEIDLLKGRTKGIRKAISYKLAQATAKVTATCCLFASLLFGVSSAHADVPINRIVYIDFNMNSPGDHSGSSMQSRYAQMINEIRNATGHTFRQTVLATQGNSNPGIIRIRFISGATQTLLWISPQDLYVRGFTNVHGQTFQFNDPEYDLANQLRDLEYQAGTIRTLSYGSNYNELSGRDAANRGRGATPLNYNSFWNTFFNLAFMTDPTGPRTRESAQSLMTMIQITSEAVRFPDVYNVIYNAMGAGTYTGLPAYQQVLENRWGAISEWAFTLNNNPGVGPLVVRGANPNNGDSPTSAPNDLTLRSWADVQRYLRVLLNAPNGLGNGGSAGNWGRTEL
ncbi:hypothetical protein HDE68_002989 [Pedobacter cryoconitis]|uniref:Uncharacterized protein n=1 Tax=Pedobacter cryoconitis TaxID=188932 RepID=A0A7W8ZN65_9SPHI|nr:ribosome-inactivating family protein [Pedobacter cryoconitis]MBB5637076.1 hypothetical protein [Pedobacter cryoconitis]